MKRALATLLFALILIPTTANAAKTKKKVPPVAPKEMQEPVLESKKAAVRGPRIDTERKQVKSEGDEGEIVSNPGSGPAPFGAPVEMRMTRAARKRFDVRSLPQTRPVPMQRHDHPRLQPSPVMLGERSLPPETAAPSVPERNAPAPAPLVSFNGLDQANWGAGFPPDTVGDVGPEHYVQAINTSVGIYQKSDGTQLAAFTFNTLMSQGNFGNLCDTNNFGDPVVLYDSFEDRWILSDFAFSVTAGSVNNPPGAFQCFAVSLTGDPVSGGWAFYSINTTGGLGDYPKLGVWTDGIYMAVNMFGYPAGAPFQSARVYAFNKAQMYAGAPSVQVVSFNETSGDFTLLPSNARLQTGTPPAGTPNYFVSTWQFLNALTVYKFHVDWDSISLSTFTGPDEPLAATSWPNAAVANAPSQGGNNLDVLQIRAMMQNQYTNIGGVESLWNTHTVRRGNTTGFAAPRWYQVDVTGGTVNPNIPQAATWDPDAANVMHRFMPSLAVDRGGNMALGYSTSSSTTKPAIQYAGRLATDPVNTFSQTEQLLIQGAGTQVGNCGSGPCTRWGDYSAMTLDPDGCTFWFTTEYYAVDGLNYQTRVGSFAYPECTPVGAGGTVSGTVTATTGGAPLSGATVELGSRTTTTNGSGLYSFTDIPAGTYPSLTASLAGYVTETVTEIVVTDGGTTTEDFALDTAPTSACATDTTQSDFLGGILTNVDATTTPGDVILAKPSLDQFNSIVGTSGVGVTVTTWGGQTFTPAVSGLLTQVDINMFCSGCTGTIPNLTLSIRATAGGIPTGADLASGTIPGFNNGASAYYTATFGTPPTLTAGTMYAIVIRPTANPAPGTYALTRSGTASLGASVYPGGTRVSGATSGTVWSIPLTGGVSTDAGFVTYMDSGFITAGDLVSALKDSNPLAGLTPIWTTLSWTATTPANTSIQFQVAGSNSPSGPFSFVGPDGTAGTFFTTSGASLSQFYGLRYLRYKAYLATTDTAVSPTLSDVSLCYNNSDCSGPGPVITPTPAQVCPSSTGNTASGPAGATSYAWSITNGTITGGAATQTVTYDAGASGDVGLTLDIVDGAGCQRTNSINVPIVVSSTPTITPGGPTSFCNGGSVTLTSSSASGNQWYLNGNPIGGEINQTYVATASGDYTVVATVSGCASAPSAATTVTVTPSPATPTITPGGPTTFCAGGSVTLTSSSASGNQWYLNGNPIGGEINQTYVATASGNYTVVVTVSGCASAPSAATTVTVNPAPATPTITPGGPTTFCTGGSVTLTSSSASGNQWYLNGNPIGGETNQNYVATASGDYTVVVTASGCPSAPSSATTVTVNPAPATPTITPGGPTSFCTGGSVTLTSSSASGNQWYLNGNPIGGETNQTYVAAASGDYTVVVTASGCSSAASATTTVTVNPNPVATITAPASVVAASTGNAASVPNAGVGATYAWTIGNGTITAGAGTAAITFTAGVVGALTLDVTVTTAATCSDSDSANVTVTAGPPAVTVTSVTPTSGSTLGGTSVTIGGTGFNAGAAVTFGGTAATSVVVVNATQITATTPAHAAGAVNVVVTNTDTSTGTLTNGFTYNQQNFDPNGDSMIDPSDIFYLVAYLFTGGPAPSGVAGMPSGDANGDGVVDPADIFYTVYYLFGGGPAPFVRAPGATVTTSDATTLAGALTLGQPVLRNGRWSVPVILTADAGSPVPQSLSLRVRTSGEVSDVVIRRRAGLDSMFEINRHTENAISYLVAYGEAAPLVLNDARSTVVAEIELTSTGAARLELDPVLTMFTDADGRQKATVGNGSLRLRGITIGRIDPTPSERSPRQQQ